MDKRKILAFSAYRSEYLKMRSVLLALKNNQNIDLKIVSMGGHNLNRFGMTSQNILKDGLEISYYLYTNVEGDNPSSMAHSVGIGINQIIPILNYEKPDIVLISADRYDVFSVAIASNISNFVVAHLQGGEKSGSVDDNIRHAITKLSHLHFPATEESMYRIIRMGENKNHVFNLGCCFIDYIKELKINKNKQEFLNNFPLLNSNKSYGIVIQHPVTTEYNNSFEQMTTTLNALQNFGTQCLLVWPNCDSGAEEMSRAVRVHKEKFKEKNIIIDAWRSIDASLYLNLLYHSDFLIGNSSSGIRESHIFGVPSINIGNRQQGRERTKNVIDVEYNAKQIYNTLKKYSGKRIYDNNIYGDGNAGRKIANILETIDLTNLIDKRFCD